jgi:serine/threonine protein kinase
VATPPNLLLGRYQLLNKLGAGGFGEVWRAQDTHQDAIVAVKLIGPHVTIDQVLLEARLLTRLLNHERIIGIRNLLVGPIPLIVMDYLPNGSLEDRLANGSVSIAEATRWAREGLDGLAHAHELGVLHRDIKPANLILDNEERVVVSDFGIAEDTLKNLIASRAVYRLHAAPELLTGSPSSPATDIWAMGCTFYRLLTGEYPFADEHEIANGRPADVHRLNPQIPLALTRVVQKALAPNPANRYATAREMITDLTRCRVACGWQRLPPDGALERWGTTLGQATYELTLREIKGGSFEVRMRKDIGSGLRQVSKGRFDRHAAAHLKRRRLLMAVVEGKHL